MPVVTQKFIDDPKKFLDEYVVKVADPTIANGHEVTAKFDFVQDYEATVATLKKADNGLITACFLKWAEGKTTSATLDPEKAKYFFTSQLTNCSFAVFGNKLKPTVYHTAGTLFGTPKKDAEKKVDPLSRGKKEARLSRTNLKLHEYRGQDNLKDQSSAFVYGIFKEKEWEFDAQIVEGNLEKFIPRANCTVPKKRSPFHFKPDYDPD
jgi:hypothetical protein